MMLSVIVINEETTHCSLMFSYRVATSMFMIIEEVRGIELGNCCILGGRNWFEQQNDINSLLLREQPNPEFLIAIGKSFNYLMGVGKKMSTRHWHAERC